MKWIARVKTRPQEIVTTFMKIQSHTGWDYMEINKILFVLYEKINRQSYRDKYLKSCVNDSR